VLEHRNAPNRSNLDWRLHGSANSISRSSPRIEASVRSLNLGGSRRHYPVLALDTEPPMTRFCIHCNRNIGEKCAHCGSEATPLKTSSSCGAMHGTEFDCPACGHRFSQGEGGEFGGICGSCFISELRSVHEQVAMTYVSKNLLRNKETR